MLAGLSGLYIFRMPPCFWANATSAANIARNNEPAAANPRRFRFISVYLPRLSRVRRAASRLRTPAKPAVAPCYAWPICWALMAGADAREDTHLSAPRPARRKVRHDRYDWALRRGRRCATAVPAWQ